jgi:hypothetical protein
LPVNWRPAADEARFAAENGFACVQLRCDHPNGVEDVLRDSALRAGAAFGEAGTEVAIEVLVRAGPEEPDIVTIVESTLPDAHAASGDEPPPAARPRQRRRPRRRGGARRRTLRRRGRARDRRHARSGGYGRDTDEALRESRRLLLAAD